MASSVDACRNLEYHGTVDDRYNRFPMTFPRERLVPIPNAGQPTHEERTWRRDYPQMSTRERWEAMIREKTVDEWARILIGEDLRWSLRAVRYLKIIVSAQEERLVRRARDLELCWDEIGYYLGLSRQSVHRRFAKRIGPAKG